MQADQPGEKATVHSICGWGLPPDQINLFVSKHIEHPAALMASKNGPHTWHEHCRPHIGVHLSTSLQGQSLCHECIVVACSCHCTHLIESLLLTTLHSMSPEPNSSGKQHLQKLALGCVFSLKVGLPYRKVYAQLHSHSTTSHSMHMHSHQAGTSSPAAH